MSATATAPLFSVMEGTNAEAIDGLLRVLFPDARTALDMTYGKGGFWGPEPRVAVTGLDADPARSRDVCGDFTRLPFLNDSFDVAIFDPPFQADMGRGKASIMGSQFSVASSMTELERLVNHGCWEASQVARLGVIVKVQDYIHASEAVWMSDWVRAVMGVPYDSLILHRGRKLMDPKWTRQLSVWRTHSTFWVYRWDGPKHKARIARSG